MNAAEISSEIEVKVHAEINRLSSKKDWPRLQEGQLELVRVAKKYARDIPHLHGAITALCESLDHCPDSRELRLELRGDVSALDQSTRCPLCEDGGTVHRNSAYVRCTCRIGRMIHQGTLDELNNPPAPKAVPDPVNAATVAKVLAAPVTQGDIDREVQTRKRLATDTQRKQRVGQALVAKEGE